MNSARNRLGPLELDGTVDKDKTPVPSPNDSSTHNADSDGDKRSPIVPVDIFVKHTQGDDVRNHENPGKKLPLTRTMSADSASEFRPSLLARAQIFFQKQLEGFSSAASTISNNSENNNTSLSNNKTNGEVQKSKGGEGDRENVVNPSDVTDTDNQSLISSLDTDTSNTTATVRNVVRESKSLPPVNARHVTPEKLMKQKIQNRDKSPYRLMPDVARRGQYLSANSPNNSQGKRSFSKRLYTS